MKDDIQAAIKLLTQMIMGKVDSADALRYTQAALNLTHIQLNWKEVEKMPIVTIESTADLPISIDGYVPLSPDVVYHFATPMKIANYSVSPQ